MEKEFRYENVMIQLTTSCQQNIYFQEDGPNVSTLPQGGHDGEADARKSQRIYT